MGEGKVFEKTLDVRLFNWESVVFIVLMRRSVGKG